MAMNAGYNATLFILQQEYIRVYMFAKVLVGILQKQRNCVYLLQDNHKIVC